MKYVVCCHLGSWNGFFECGLGDVSKDVMVHLHQAHARVRRTAHTPHDHQGSHHRCPHLTCLLDYGVRSVVSALQSMQEDKQSDQRTSKQRQEGMQQLEGRKWQATKQRQEGKQRRESKQRQEDKQKL
jgi:hypothetical protein